MSDIATKLQYLNITKSKIKDSINLTGANITNNDTFRSYADKLKDSLLDVLNNDCTQSMKDTENECKQIAIIKQKHDRAYYTKSSKL